MTARRKGNGNTESVDNYLKAILALGGTDGRRVASKELADRLGVAPASVTNMLQKLAGAAAPLVEYERHRGVSLSAGGRKRALEVLRHHRLIETFLYEILDYPIEEVHEEAERLEHFISERFEERIAAKLGHPKLDPHGHSIPTMEGEMARRESILLTEVVEDGTFEIESISDRDARNLRLIEACGLTPGTRVRACKNSTNDSYSVRVMERPRKSCELSREVAGDVRLAPVQISFTGPWERITVAGQPILHAPPSADDYPDFLTWWMAVGRLNPLDSEGWSTYSGPGVMWDRQEAIPPERWEALPESERELIRNWAETIEIGMFYD